MAIRVKRSVINARYGDKGRTLLGLLADNPGITSGATYKKILLMGANVNKRTTARGMNYQSDVFLNQVAAWGDNKMTAEVLLLLINFSKNKRLYSPFDPNTQDHHKNSVIHYLSARGAMHGLRLLLESEGVEMDSQNRNGKTPLNKAIEQGHEEVVKLLISRGSNIFNKSLGCNMYPFDHALQEDSFRTAHLILKAGFSIEYSMYCGDIKAGKIPKLKWKETSCRVPTLFELTRDRLRAQLLSREKNLTSKAIGGLQLPRRLRESLFIFN